jgi:hypothetical protein
MSSVCLAQFTQLLSNFTLSDKTDGTYTPRPHPEALLTTSPGAQHPLSKATEYVNKHAARIRADLHALRHNRHLSSVAEEATPLSPSTPLVSASEQAPPSTCSSTRWSSSDTTQAEATVAGDDPWEYTELTVDGWRIGWIEEEKSFVKRKGRGEFRA